MTEELSSAERDAVRRLLREARPTGELPPEVAARLDATLSSLLAERVEASEVPGVSAPAPVDGVHSGDGSDGVDELAARRTRRRRIGAGVLVAAAATALVAAVGPTLTTTSDGDSSTADAKSAGDVSEATVDQDSAGALAEAEGTVPGRSYGAAPDELKDKPELEGTSSAPQLNLSTRSAYSSLGAAPRADRRVVKAALPHLPVSTDDRRNLMRSTQDTATEGYAANRVTVGCGPVFSPADMSLVHLPGRFLVATVSAPDPTGVRTVSFYDCAGETPNAVWESVRVASAD